MLAAPQVIGSWVHLCSCTFVFHKHSKTHCFVALGSAVPSHSYPFYFTLSNVTPLSRCGVGNGFVIAAWPLQTPHFGSQQPQSSLAHHQFRPQQLTVWVNRGTFEIDSGLCSHIATKRLYHLQDFSKVSFRLQVPHLQGSGVLSPLKPIRNAVANMSYGFLSISLETRMPRETVLHFTNP